MAGKASLLLSDHKAAIDYSLSALAKGERSSSAYSGLGIAYLKNENMRLAKASFKKAAELDPSNYQAQFNLAISNGVTINYRSNQLENVEYHNDTSLTVTVFNDFKKLGAIGQTFGFNFSQGL